MGGKTFNQFGWSFANQPNCIAQQINLIPADHEITTKSSKRNSLYGCTSTWKRFSGTRVDFEAVTLDMTSEWPLFKLNHMTYMHRFTSDNLETPYFTLPLSSPAEVNRMIGSRNFYLRVYFFQHHQHEDRDDGRGSRDQRSSQGGWN